MASSSEAGSMCRWAAQRYPGVRICLSGISMGGALNNIIPPSDPLLTPFRPASDPLLTPFRPPSDPLLTPF
eukprot:1004193-Prorocentrum_minimum.AAC.1